MWKTGDYRWGRRGLRSLDVRNWRKDVTTSFLFSFFLFFVQNFFIFHLISHTRFFYKEVVYKKVLLDWPKPSKNLRMFWYLVLSKLEKVLIFGSPRLSSPLASIPLWITPAPWLTLALRLPEKRSEYLESFKVLRTRNFQNFFRKSSARRI